LPFKEYFHPGAYQRFRQKGIGRRKQQPFEKVLFYAESMPAAKDTAGVQEGLKKNTFVQPGGFSGSQHCRCGQ
jgi:hypothetical protein